MTTANRSHAVPLSDWQPTASGNAQLRVATAARRSVGRDAARTPAAALQLDYDFNGGQGFVVARRAFTLDMPREYTVRFRLRARGAVNNLEIKLLDAGGLNVWRHVLVDLPPPPRWKRFCIESRDIVFAWGPASGSAIGQLGFIELALVAGQGGAGTVWIADLAIEDTTPRHPPRATASSELPGHGAGEALSGGAWAPRPDEARPWLAIDCTEPRMLGGLVVDWRKGAPSGGFRVRASLDGRRFKTVYGAAHAGGERAYVYLPALRTRHLRLELNGPSGGASVSLEPFDFSRSIEAFWYAIAAREPRGRHPRWLHREQTEWTPIGSAHGRECALINTDGMVEVRRASFSLEPMLWLDGRLYTWADVEIQVALEAGWMPVPRVTWTVGSRLLSIEAQGSENAALRVRYRLEDLGERAPAASARARDAAGAGRGEQAVSLAVDAASSRGDARLLVLIRPFQVTPPWQSFRDVGGVSRIHELQLDGDAVRVDQVARIVASGSRFEFGALAFDEGIIAARLDRGSWPEASRVEDPFGFASAMLGFDAASAAGGEWVLECTPWGSPPASAGSAFDWQRALPVGQWSGPGTLASAVTTALTATAQVLVTRSGPALQPGPRRYTRSWIRDGAMMSAALLRMRRADVVAEFIRWYAPHQREDGFVPCCVDDQGIDWLVEHDSHGELIALIADHHRFSGDQAFVEAHWRFVQRAVGYIERVLEPGGLMPISVSHEGYLAQPVHAYWDGFWTLRGVRDAAWLADRFGRADETLRWRALADRIERALFESIDATRAARGLDYVPGSIEWADFDPTATANALYLFDVHPGFDRPALERTFDKYLADWRAKRSGATAWANYTPYEIRIIGALVRLGRREAARELLEFFLSDKRPVPWNQWPEIAWRDRAAPAHVGDLPHTWIAAEYVLALRSLFAYEQERERSLVLAAGIVDAWLQGEGVRVRAMPTAYGPLSYTLTRLDEHTVRFQIQQAPGVALSLRPPLDSPLVRVVVDGVALEPVPNATIELATSPAEVICVSN